MVDVVYLTVLDVEALHVFIMERTGGIPQHDFETGVLLDSELMRPQLAAHYENADLIQQAALLSLGISQAQAFIQGIKRTACMAADVFLRANGCVFQGDPLEIARQLEAVAVRTKTEAEATAGFADWLRCRVTGA